MMKAIHLTVLILIIAVVVSTAIYLQQEQEETKLKVIYAGSLIVPFEEIEKQFESQHTGVDVQMEGHGSIQVIRQVIDIHKAVEVVAVADYSLIPDMMYTTKSGDYYADWHVKFATNQMVIAYNNKSKYADEINESNWYEILGRPEVKFGFSNPMLDSCGYRTLMVIQLAELYYNNQMIFDDLIACNFDPTISVTKNGDTSIVFVPEIFEPRAEKVVVRGGSVQLLALLDYGGLDYAFQYKSVAQQHGLRFLELPPPIDLSSSEYERDYKKVIVQLGFQRFASAGIERVGRPIYYGMTIPRNAPQPELAVEFVKFVIGKKGQRVLGDLEQPTIQPVTDKFDVIPDELRSVVIKETKR